MAVYNGKMSAGEEISTRLRALYREWGFLPYKVNRFEEYDLYMRFKSFLTDERVLTFTDTDGKLMALKPDITLSVVKNAREADYPLRICYTESVYRVPRGAIGFREITQTGIESIGFLTDWEYCEALLLAAKSLETIAPGRWRLDVSDQGILADLMAAEHLTGEQQADVLQLIRAKNLPGIRALPLEASARALTEALMELSGPLKETAEKAMALPLAQTSLKRLALLRDMGEAAEALGLDNTALDFSAVSDMRYYNGLVFCGYADGAAAPVLSGGRYDPVLASLGKKGSAVGFAVYLDQAERLTPTPREEKAYTPPKGGSLKDMALDKASQLREDA